MAESIELFIDDQAFSRLCDFAPRLPFVPLPSVNFYRRHRGRLRKRENLLTREGVKGVGEEPNHTKDCSSINHSTLSACGSAMYIDLEHKHKCSLLAACHW